MDPDILPQPASTPMSTQPPHSKNKIWLWVLAGVLLLGVGIVVGVFLGKNLYSPLQIVPTPTPSSIIDVSPADPTANWKMYVNNELGISFKIIDPELVVSDYTIFAQKSKKAQFAIFVDGRAHYNTKIEKCESPIIIKDCFVDASSWEQKEKIKTTTLGGTDAISYFVNDAVIGEPIHIVETTSSPIIQIAQVVGGVGLNDEFDQILSTFKFVDQNVTQ